MVSEHFRINNIKCLTFVNILDQSSEIEGAHPPQKTGSRRVIRVGDFRMIHKAMYSPS